MMRGAMISLAILLLISIATYADIDNLAYRISLKYTAEGNLNIEETELIEGTGPDRRNQPEEGYTLKVVSFGGETLHSFRFLLEISPNYALKREWFDENGTQIYFPNTTTYSENTMVLVFPYFRNAKLIEIYDQNEALVISYDISRYAVCNMNGGCEVNENHKVCPEDCLALVDDTTNGQPQRELFIIIVIMILLILVTVILLYFANGQEERLR